MILENGLAQEVRLLDLPFLNGPLVHGITITIFMSGLAGVIRDRPGICFGVIPVIVDNGQLPHIVAPGRKVLFQTGQAGGIGTDGENGPGKHVGQRVQYNIRSQGQGSGCHTDKVRSGGHNHIPPGCLFIQACQDS